MDKLNVAIDDNEIMLQMLDYCEQLMRSCRWLEKLRRRRTG